MIPRKRWLVVLAVVLSGCSGSDSPELGLTDAAEDAGALDQGASDVSVSDEGQPDLGPPDMGADDGGLLDEGLSDTGFADANPPNPWTAVSDVAAAHEIPQMVLYIGNADGPLHTYIKGNPNLDTRVPIASATKWYAAAVFAGLIDAGVMSLSSRPQDFLSFWTTDPSDARSRVTLEQLLSFTSGMQGRPGSVACVAMAQSSLQSCAEDVFNNNFAYEPGTTFFYGPTHMTVAAAMAEVATGQTWAQLVDQYLSQPLGLSNTDFAPARRANPNVAGGMRSTARDYGLFLQGFLSGGFLPNWTTELSNDRTATATLAFSPVSEGTLGAEWHYGLGHWLECDMPPFAQNCVNGQVFSSPGAFGYYPWIDRERGYWGVLAVLLTGNRAGTISYDLVSQLRPLISAALP